MERKFIFFDIDGTLTDDNPGGKILESTFRALEQLKKNGHFVAIATGRAQWMAIDFAKASGIDHMVSDGGNGLTVDGELLYIKPLDFNAANRVIDDCILHHYAYAVSISNEDVLYSNCHDIEKYTMHVKTIVDETIDFHQVNAIYKIYIYLTPEEEKNLKLDKLDYMRYLDDQIIVEPTEKYQGILEMVRIMGGNEKDIVVFGDGHNDYSMIKQAPLGIAMGNAAQEIKDIADFITKRNDEDGIEYACQYFGWI